MSDNQRQPKPNSGVLFENDRKTTDKHPDRKGSLRVTCPACGAEADFWLDGWINRTKEGNRRYLSVKVKPKEAPAQAAAPAPRVAAEDVPGYQPPSCAPGDDGDDFSPPF
jgi:hypothetical protein